MTGGDLHGVRHLDIIPLGAYYHGLEYCSTCVWKCCMICATGMIKMSSLSELCHCALRHVHTVLSVTATCVHPVAVTKSSRLQNMMDIVRTERK